MSDQNSGTAASVPRDGEGSAGEDLRRDLSAGPLGRVVFWFGVALSLFHVYANTLGTLPELSQSAIHWGGFGFLCAVMVPMSARLARRAGTALLALDAAIGLLAVACAVYVILAFDPLYDRGVSFIASDWVFAVIAVGWRSSSRAARPAGSFRCSAWSGCSTSSGGAS